MPRSEPEHPLHIRLRATVTPLDEYFLNQPEHRASLVHQPVGVGAFSGSQLFHAQRMEEMGFSWTLGAVRGGNDKTGRH